MTTSRMTTKSISRTTELRVTKRELIEMLRDKYATDLDVQAFPVDGVTEMSATPGIVTLKFTTAPRSS